MKIAIPSMDETLDSSISSNLGRSPFIIIYDSENKEYHSLVNMGHKLQDGSGLKVVEIIIHNNVDTLLTMEVGRKAYSVLLKEKINIQLLNSGSTVKSAISKFLKKQG